MKRLIAGMMERFGVLTRFETRSGTSSLKTFFQLVTSKNWQNMDRMVPTGGEIPRGQYLMIAPPWAQVEAADRIVVKGHSYTVRRADTIYYRDEPLYIWALCVEGGDADPWTS